jgi:hypothetical protein
VAQVQRNRFLRAGVVLNHQDAKFCHWPPRSRSPSATALRQATPALACG